MSAIHPFTDVIRDYNIPVFGVAGTHVLKFLKGLSAENLSHLYFTCTTETAAGFSSIGYSRATGKPSICLLTPGPGFLIGTATIHEARMKGTPVIFIVGELPKAQLEISGKALHELPHQSEIGRLLSGNTRRVESPESADRVLQEAIADSASIPRSPQIIEVPVDALNPASTKRKEASLPEEKKDFAPLRELEEALELLEKAEAPSIYAGYGATVPPCSELMENLAIKLGAPVFTSISGKGAVSENLHISGGVITRKVAEEILSRSDVVLALGTVLSLASTFNRTLPFPDKCILVSLDETTPTYPRARILHVRMRVESFLEEALNNLGSRPRSLAEKVERARRKLAEEARARFPLEMSFLEAIQHSAPSDASFFADPTIISYWGRYFLPADGPGRHQYPWGGNSLGYAVPAARGASIWDGSRKVVLTGDGNVPYWVMELVHLKENEIPVTVVVFNDESYGVLKKWRGWKDARPLGVDLPKLPLHNICDGFGIDYNKCDSPSGLAVALEKFTSDGVGPNLIEVRAELSPPWGVL